MIKNSKLIQLLAPLSTLEMKRFKKFLESPFHNSNEQMTQLFSYLKRFHPTYDTPALTKERLYKKIFGNKAFNQQRIYDLMHDLRKLVEDFLIVSNILDIKEERQMALVNTLAKRNHPFFRDESQKIIKTIENKTTYLTVNDYRKLQWIYNQLWFHVDTQKDNQEALEFSAAHENLDLFYITTKLYYFTEQEGRKKIYNQIENTRFQKEILDFVEQQKEDYPHLFLLRQMIDLILGNIGERNFFVLKEQVQTYAPRIEKDLLRDLFIHLANYCIQKNNRGKIAFLKETLNLYKIMLDNDLLIIDGKIGDVLFINISNLANKCGEIEWAKKFRIDYGNYLDNQNIEETKNICEVYNLFYEKRYTAANELINLMKIKSSSTFYFGIQVHLMKGLYDDWVKLGVNNAETLLDQIGAFEQLVKRNKSFTQEKLIAYLNYGKFFKALIKLRKLPKRPLEKIEALEKAIFDHRLLAFKGWLLEKIKEHKK